MGATNYNEMMINAARHNNLQAIKLGERWVSKVKQNVLHNPECDIQHIKQEERIIIKLNLNESNNAKYKPEYNPTHNPEYKIQPINYNAIVYEASKYGHIEIINCFMNSAMFIHNFNYCNILEGLTLGNHLSILKNLNIPYDTFPNKPLLIAINKQNVEMLDY
jgi:hypothetical protein